MNTGLLICGNTIGAVTTAGHETPRGGGPGDDAHTRPSMPPALVVNQHGGRIVQTLPWETEMEYRAVADGPGLGALTFASTAPALE